MLVRRRPAQESRALEVAPLFAGVHTDTLIGHVSDTAGALGEVHNPAIASPFRYRQWLFAQTGRLAAFADARTPLVASVPEFLRAGIQGGTDAEVIFHLFLSFLHDAGQLDDRDSSPLAIAEALRSALAQSDTVSSEFAAGPSRVNLMVTNGACLVALRGSEAMATRAFAGRADADALFADDAELLRRIPDVERVAFTLIASDFEGGAVPPLWNTVPDRAMVILTRAGAPRLELF